MCGLVGMAGRIGIKEEEMFRDLLAVDVIRGAHSTGIVSVGPEGIADWAKAAMLPQDFMQTRQFKQAFSGAHVLLMGHNRYATKGAINTANAHPFETENLTGMHNGTLINWQAKLEEPNKFDVDSECLLYTMDIRGIKATFAELNGAFALTWHDERDNTFNILRNDDRPLFSRLSKSKETLFYASEAWMIDACAWRRGVELDNTIFNVPVGKHLSWELPRKAYEGLGKGRTAKVPLYTPPPAATYHGHGNWQGRGAAGQQSGYPAQLPPPNTIAREYADLMHTDVKFYATDVEPMNQRVVGATVIGMLVDPPYHPVRVRTSVAESDTLLKHMGVVEGRVTSYVAPYNLGEEENIGHLTIRADTLKYISLEDHEGDDDTDEIEVVLGPDDKMISKEEFDKLTKGGCSMCSVNLIYGLDEAMWEGNEPLCEECYDELTTGNVTKIGGVK